MHSPKVYTSVSDLHYLNLAGHRQCSSKLCFVLLNGRVYLKDRNTTKDMSDTADQLAMNGLPTQQLLQKFHHPSDSKAVM